MEQLYWEQLYWRASGGPGTQQVECSDWYIADLSQSGLGTFTGRVTASKRIEEHYCSIHFTVSVVLHPMLGPLI